MTLFDYLSQPACALVTRIVVPAGWAGVRVPDTVTVETADIDGYVQLFDGSAAKWSVSTGGLVYEASP